MAQVAAQKAPVIVLGDCNTTEMSDAYSAMTSTLTEVHPAVGRGLGHTFPSYVGRWMGLPIIPRQLRLDMVLVSDQIVPLHSHVGDEYGESDRLPVFAELYWRD